MPAVSQDQVQTGSSEIDYHFHTENIFVKVTTAICAGPESTQPAQYHLYALKAIARVAE